MPDDPHYFIGFPVPQEYKEYLAKWQEALKPFVDYRKWVHGQDFHITVRFLGGVNAKKLSDIKRLLKNIEQSPLHLKMSGLNFFGKEDQPRVMYAEIERNQEVLDFKQQVDDYLETIEIEKEKRPYRPHITIAKKWGKGKLHLSKEALENKLEEPRTFSFGVEQLNLYRIHPSREQKYEVIETFELK